MGEVRSVDRRCAGHSDCTWETVRRVRRQGRLPRTRRTWRSRCRRCCGLVDVQPEPRRSLVAPGARTWSSTPTTHYGSAEAEHEPWDQCGSPAGSDRDAHSRGEEAPRSRSRGGGFGQRPAAGRKSWIRPRRPGRRRRRGGSAPSPGPSTCGRRWTGGPRGSDDQVGPPQF